MTVTATSLKIPKNLKARISKLAKLADESPHAFMLRALEQQVEAAERYQRFIQEATQADKAMRESGVGYRAEEVHAYLEAKIAGQPAPRPKPHRWRK
jgi:predicted transcriptional regulator